MAQGIHTVVVTGFGPFRSHEINASWEIAKQLTKMGLECHGINLIAEEIPVSYATVSKEVPSMWEEYEPKLVVHMGLSSLSKVIKLESIAHRRGYYKSDIDGNTPAGGSSSGKQEVLCTQFDLVNIVNKIKKLPDILVSVELSADAGRYVCEFTYYTSLNINNCRTVFVHVPDIDKPYTVKEMAQCIKYIILYLIEEIEKPLEPEKRMCN